MRAEVMFAAAARGGGIARLAQRLAGLDHRLDARRVEALFDALTLTSVYERLTARHGWSADDDEAWLAAALRTHIRGATPRVVRFSDAYRSDPDEP
jgi:hypothetical protein